MEQPRRDPNEPTRDEMDPVRRDEPAPVRDDTVNRVPMTSERDRTMDGREPEDLWPPMSDFRRRFDEIQVEFVEEPREAVKKAEDLLREVVERMTGSLNSRLQTIHAEVGDGNSDTERLRLAMQRLRRLIDAFEERRAA
jgi:hypothetical protein